MPLTLLLGGQKSGKSSSAAALARQADRPVTVLAPARADDPELAARIARHRADRPAHWETQERFDLASALEELDDHRTVLVDALDTWLLERMGAAGMLTGAPIAPADDVAEQAGRAVLQEVETLAERAAARAGLTVVIAGQPGLGPHGVGADARRYIDLHGLACQRLAGRASQASLVVAGRLLPLHETSLSPSSASDDAPAVAASSPTPWARRPAPPITVEPLSDEQALAGCERLRRAVGPADDAAAKRARARLERLATPPGALGGLGELAVRLAAITGSERPPAPGRPALLVAAGDHGVHAQGVTPWPQQLTSTLIRAVAERQAAVGAVADEAGARMTVLDVGSAGAPVIDPSVVTCRAVTGTADLRVTDAMAPAAAARALLAGARAADALIAEGADLLCLGDLGIANTTASAALVAALTGADAAEATGPGTGVDAATLRHKRTVVADAAARVADRDALGVLAGVGGAEHAALVGACAAAARAGVPVLLDGVITLAAALVAVAWQEPIRDALLTSHRSPEPGAALALQWLGLEPLLDAGLRLGEGAGAALAVGHVRTAARVLAETAELDEL